MLCKLSQSVPRGLQSSYHTPRGDESRGVLKELKKTNELLATVVTHDENMEMRMERVESGLFSHHLSAAARGSGYVGSRAKKSKGQVPSPVKVIYTVLYSMPNLIPLPSPLLCA